MLEKLQRIFRGEGQKSPGTENIATVQQLLYAFDLVETEHTKEYLARVIDYYLKCNRSFNAESPEWKVIKAIIPEANIHGVSRILETIPRDNLHIIRLELARDGLPIPSYTN